MVIVGAKRRSRLYVGADWLGREYEIGRRNPVMIYTILGFLSAAGVVFGLYAYFNVRSTYAKYSQVPAEKNITGRKIVRAFVKEFDVKNVSVEQVGGFLTDHYDPNERVIRLSKDVYSGNSLAALGIAAHESGHAVQDAQDYLPFKARAAMVPVVNALALLSMPVGFLGFVYDPLLINIAALFLIALILFYVVTLPIEFDASARAVALLRNKNYLTEDELNGVRKVLTAAALTYIAGLLVVLMRFVSFAFGRQK